jgi:hypothetical protein
MKGRPASGCAAKPDYLEKHGRAEFNIPGITFGTRYGASPVIAHDGSPAPPDVPNSYEPSASPGGRAPHLWLDDGLSLFDTFGFEWTLLRLGPAPRPATACSTPPAGAGSSSNSSTCRRRRHATSTRPRSRLSGPTRSSHGAASMTRTRTPWRRSPSVTAATTRGAEARTTARRGRRSAGPAGHGRAASAAPGPHRARSYAAGSSVSVARGSPGRLARGSRGRPRCPSRRSFRPGS